MHHHLLSSLVRPNLLQRIWKKIRSLFILDQWIILIAPSTGYKFLSWSDFKPIIPPFDRFWADPFVWMHDDRYYIFIEEVLYSTYRGRIVCLALDKDMNILSNQVVLERPYHLSYPFLFKHEGQLYMVPETKENNGVELYRCTHFPDQWEFVKTLIDNVRARDATLLEASGKWWLFTNIQETGGLSWDNLHLYYTDRPISGQWTPHPHNPIVKDIHSARPAGRIFSYDNTLIRPSQDCSVRYGYAINFNRIATLTETDYVETTERAFKPPDKGRFLATHTFNEMAGLTAIDAIHRWHKY